MQAEIAESERDSTKSGHTDSKGESVRPKQAFLHKERRSDVRNIVLITVPIFSIYVFLISQLQQLPGPLYGGDVYWHYGETLNIYNGAAPWENAQVVGEYAYFGWLSQLFIAILAKITGISLMSVFLYFTALSVLIGGFVSYYLGLEVFRKRAFGMLCCMMWIGLTCMIISPTRALDVYVLAPLFMLALTKLLNTMRMKYAVLTGLVAGIGSLAYITMLPAMIIVLFVAFLYTATKDHIRIDFADGGMRFNVQHGVPKAPSILRALRLFVPLAAVCASISLIFYFPFIVYHGQLNNPTNIYTRVDLSKYGIGAAFSMLSQAFFDVGSLTSGNFFAFIVSMISLVGLYAAIKARKYAVIILFVAALVGGFHYLFTLPLFGTYIIPMDIFSKILSIATPLLFLCAIEMACDTFTRYRKHILIAATAFLSIGVVLTFSTTYNDRWFNVGKTSPDTVLSEISDWVGANTDRNAVFLSTEELSFSLNGLTARKLVVSRRTHFSHFLDIDTRIADMAVALYGNNENKTVELLRKYNVSYLYWDANWMYFAQNEPTMVPPAFEDYLVSNGVVFQRINTQLDPAGSALYKKLDMLAVIPAKNSLDQPWSDSLNKHIALVKEVVADGNAFARIYNLSY